MNISVKTRVPILVLLVSIFLTASCDSERPRLAAGDPAPSFTLPRLEGKQVRFPEDYAGQVVAIRFWADWCPYCKDEMTAIEPVYQRYRDKGLRILAVNVRQSASVAGAFVKKLNISYEVLLDEEGEVARNFGVAGLPTTFIVDRSGTIKNRIIGEATAEVFEQVIAQSI